MKSKVNILLLGGGGGRESALAWKILQSPRIERLFVGPGSYPGAIQVPDLNPKNFSQIADFVKANDVDLVMVGSEETIVMGIADALAEENIKVIAPCAAGAQLEGSKEFAKEFMSRHLIPTARFMTVTEETLEEGLAFLESLNPPYVLKADGLAAGKGVLIIESLDEAKESLSRMIGGMFGTASQTVVIEEFLKGRECSVIFATDGENYLILPPARDHKRLLEGDHGPNTGGMGAVSPVDFATPEFLKRVENGIIRPTLRGLREEEIPFRGFIFLGLMEVNGEPMLLEYNVRPGDPETQVIMPRLETDIIEIFEGIADSTIELKKIEVSPKACVGVVVASPGYPEAPVKGLPLGNLEKAGEGRIIFPAGMKEGTDGGYVTSGGRVMTIVALADTVEEASLSARLGACEVELEGKQFRTDIPTAI